jgi:hypothetical protein
MIETTNDHKRKLTKQQLELLDIFYTYRFATTELIRAYLHNKVTDRAVRKRLAVLCTRGYVNKRSSKEIGKPAYYCLAPGGVKLLRQTNRYSLQALRNIRHDVRSSSRFARDATGVFAAANELRTKFDDDCQILTRSYLYGKEDWPDPLPDAYIIIKDSHDKLRHHFLLECIDDTKPQRIWKQRITRLIEYIDAGEWPEDSGDSNYPALLFVCDTPRLEKFVRRWAHQAYEDALAEDVLVSTATPDTVASAVLQAKSP